MTNLIPLLALIRKDLILYVSNRRALVLNILMPIVLGGFLGYIFGGSGKSEPVKVDVALVQQDDSALGKKIGAALRNGGTLQVHEMSLQAAQEQVNTGKLMVAIVLPAGFAEAAGAAVLSGRGKPTLSIIYDPSQEATRMMVSGLLVRQIMHVLDAHMSSRGVVDNALSLPFSTNEQATSASKSQYNGYAHAFAGMTVQFILFMGIDVGVGILLARRMGLWNRLLAAPVSGEAVLLARAISSALISFCVLLVIFAVAVAVFKVSIDGSLVGLIGVAACFAMMAACFGLLIAALGKTPEAARGLASFATLVMVMLGGAWMPSFVFPQWLQSATLLMPTRWAVDGLEAMTWRGLGLDAAFPAMAALLGFTLLFGMVALWKFRRWT
jgi:ABC-2 type transport system permease protein